MQQAKIYDAKFMWLPWKKETKYTLCVLLLYIELGQEQTIQMGQK